MNFIKSSKNTRAKIYWNAPQNSTRAHAIHIFYRLLDFPPGVASDILENEPKSCLAVA